jgi:hypothetical protein
LLTRAATSAAEKQNEYRLLLTFEAKANHLQFVETAEADEVYYAAWALNTATVIQLLVD